MIKLYYVYIIENSIAHSWYIGFSEDYERRLLEHKSKSGSQFTRCQDGEWSLIYLEGYCNKKDALSREKYLKSGAGRKYIKKQLANHLENV